MIKILLAAALCLGGTTAAQAAWQEAQSRHFIVYSDDTPENVTGFTTKLERFDAAMRVLNGVADKDRSPLARVTIYVVKNMAAVQKLYGSAGAAGFYNPRAEGSVAFVPRSTGDTDMTAQAVLFHEYAHHFMYSNWGNAVFPAWFVEGFAEFNATAKIEEDGSVLFGSAPQYRAWGIDNKAIMPSSLLLTADSHRMSEAMQAIFYGRAWLLTHYLTLDPGRRRELSEYVVAINKGRTAKDAAAILDPDHRLDHHLNAYLELRTLQGFRIESREITLRPIATRALTPSEAAAMSARIASARGVDKDRAPHVATLARAAAEAFPNDPVVQNELAEAEFDAGNRIAARDAADRALAGDPRSIHAMIYAGLSRMMIAKEAKAKDPKEWTALRQWFLRANALDTEYAWPLELFYASFEAAGVPPSANAQAALLYAQQLAPFDTGLRLSAARVDLETGKLDAARAVLKPVAYAPHDPKAAALADAALIALDKSGSKAALDALRTGETDGGKEKQDVRRR